MVRKITNMPSLKEGLKARFRATVRKIHEPGAPRYGFFEAPMHWPWRKVSDPKSGNTVTKIESVCGPGLTLFMNWFLLCQALGLWLWVCATYFVPEDEKFVEWFTPCYRQEKILANSTNLRLQISPPGEGSEDYPWLLNWSVIQYIGAVVLSAGFMVCQERVWGAMQHDEAGDCSVRKFAVELHGFPEDATDKEAIKKYIQREFSYRHLPDICIVELSIIYAYSREQGKTIQNAIDRHLSEVKRQYSPPETKTLMDASASDEDSDSSTDEPPKADDPGPMWIQIFAYCMCGVPFKLNCNFGKDGSRECCQLEEEVDVEEEEEEIAGLLQTSENGGLKSAGSVIVVLRTEPIAIAVASFGKFTLRWNKDPNLICPGGEEGSLIKVRMLDGDPPTVRWLDYFDDAIGERTKRIIKVAMSLVFLVIVWLFIYSLFVEYMIDSIGDDSTVRSGTEVFLGLLVAAGNAMLAYAVQGATEYIGFRSQETLRLVQLYLTVPLVFINCVADMYITRKEAAVTLAGVPWTKGLWADLLETFTPLDPNLWTYNAQVKSIFALLVPGYILIPYLGEPLCTIVAPLAIGIWRIACDRSISPEEAERYLLPGEIEVINPPYGDMITTTMTMLFTFWLFPGPAVRNIYFWYLAFSIILYLQNRLRILRVHQYTYFGNDRLHRAESMLWALPIGILAMSAWNAIYPRTYKNNGVHQDDAPAGTDSWQLPPGMAGFFFHCLAWIFFVRFVVPTFVPRKIADDDTYEEEKSSAESHARYYDYLNTNPVEVLMSHRNRYEFNRPLTDAYPELEESESLPEDLKFDVRKEFIQLGLSDYDAAKLKIRLLNLPDGTEYDAKRFKVLVVSSDPWRMDKLRRCPTSVLVLRKNTIVLEGVCNVDDAKRRPLVLYRPSLAYLQPDVVWETSGGRCSMPRPLPLTKESRLMTQLDGEESWDNEEEYIHGMVRAVMCCPNMIRESKTRLAKTMAIL
jgi:hypothetical protein